MLKLEIELTKVIITHPLSLSDNSPMFPNKGSTEHVIVTKLTTKCV